MNTNSFKSILIKIDVDSQSFEDKYYKRRKTLQKVYSTPIKFEIENYLRKLQTRFLN